MQFQELCQTNMSQSLNTSPNATAYPRTGKRGVPQQFPRRLYKMLQSESGRSSPDMISWSESGGAFRIANVSIFSSLVLPMYFRTSKFSSFQRNLNLYGFHKIRRGPDTDMYAHPAFLRGRPELLSQLKKSTHTTADNKTRPPPKLEPVPLMDDPKVSQHVKENVEKCDEELMTIRMVSPYSSRDELRQHNIFSTHGHKCSSVFQDYERDFNVHNQIKEIESNCQFTGGDRCYRKSIIRPSIELRDKLILSQTNGISTHPKENGRLALLAVVMTRLAEQDSAANAIETAHTLG